MQADLCLCAQHICAGTWGGSRQWLLWFSSSTCPRASLLTRQLLARARLRSGSGGDRPRAEAWLGLVATSLHARLFSFSPSAGRRVGVNPDSWLTLVSHEPALCKVPPNSTSPPSPHKASRLHTTGNPPQPRPARSGQLPAPLLTNLREGFLAPSPLLRMPLTLMQARRAGTLPPGHGL